MRAINLRCKEHGVPTPTSFAYPGNGIAKEALPILKDFGIIFARRGGAPEFAYKDGRGFAYEPGLDHPLLVPSAGDARPAWTLDDFKRAVAQARHGKIAILQFHGVPDTAHKWVNSTKEQFESYLKDLADNRFTVIAMRDLAKYVDPTIVPADPWGVIEEPKAKRRRPRSRSSSARERRRRPAHLAGKHGATRYAPPENGRAAATADAVTAARSRALAIKAPRPPGRRALLVLPYLAGGVPAGRLPRGDPPAARDER